MPSEQASSTSPKQGADGDSPKTANMARRASVKIKNLLKPRPRSTGSTILSSGPNPGGPSHDANSKRWSAECPKHAPGTSFLDSDSDDSFQTAPSQRSSTTAVPTKTQSDHNAEKRGSKNLSPIEKFTEKFPSLPWTSPRTSTSSSPSQVDTEGSSSRRSSAGKRVSGAFRKLSTGSAKLIAIAKGKVSEVPWDSVEEEPEEKKEKKVWPDPPCVPPPPEWIQEQQRQGNPAWTTVMEWDSD